MIVRELLTLLGFTIDKASYDKASHAYDAMQGKITQGAKATQQAAAGLSKFGQGAQQAAQGSSMLGQALGMVQRYAAQAGLSNLLKEYTTLASDANETRGALTQLFGQENIAQVERWSQAQGAAMGRSQYDLQAYAARLGSVLGPVTASREEAQRMAQSLSELSVDLASFFNTRDEDAMVALRAGLTGEYESLKRYGIVVNDVTLAEVAQTKGITKKITEMTTAEKTELRYTAIMERSKAAQGDAIRTSDGYANSTKALQAQLKTLGIDAAKTLIPVVEKIVRIARDAATWFGEMATKSNILKAAMITLAAVAAVLAVEFYGAFILPALAVGALILLVDELITHFKGGQTAIGDFINMFLGEGGAQEWTQNLIAGFIVLKEAITDAWKAFTGTWGDLQMWKKLELALPTWMRVLLDVMREISGTKPTAGQGPTTEGGRRAADVAKDFGPARRYADERGTAAKTAADQVSMTRSLLFGTPASVAAPAAAAGAAGGPATVVVPVNSAAPVININGGNTDELVRVVKQVLADRAKADMAAVGGRGRS